MFSDVWGICHAAKKPELERQTETLFTTLIYVPEISLTSIQFPTSLPLLCLGMPVRAQLLVHVWKFFVAIE